MTPRSQMQICSIVVLGFLNVWVIAANLLLHLFALIRDDLNKPGEIIHGDQWLSKLLVWSIIAMVVGALQTIVIIVYGIIVSKSEGNSQQTKKLRIAVVIVETVFIALALAAIMVPGVDQWPATYIDTNHAMYSLIAFIVAYGIFTLVTVRSICCPDNAGQVRVVHQPPVYQQQYNPQQKYQQQPTQMYQPEQPPMYQQQPTSMYHPEQPPMYHPEQPPMYHPEQPPMYHPEQPPMYQQQPTPMYHPKQPPMYQQPE